MSKHFHLFSYLSHLLWLTFYEFFTCRRVLKNIAKETLNNQELSQLKSILNGVYLNLGFTRTIIAEYVQLQSSNDDKARQLSIYTTAEMLIQDVTLDDTLSPPQTQSLIKLMARLKSRVLELLEEQSPHYKHRQLELLRQLSDGQKADDLLRKGLWLPALSFGYHPQMSEEEISILQQLGVWIKYIDDWADRDKDLAEGKHTPFTDYSLVEAVAAMEELRQNCFTKFSKLNYTQHAKSEFLYRLSVQCICFFAYTSDLNGKLKRFKGLASRSLLASILVMVVSTRLVLKRLLSIS
jgi:hypothetical protein